MNYPKIKELLFKCKKRKYRKGFYSYLKSLNYNEYEELYIYYIEQVDVPSKKKLFSYIFKTTEYYKIEDIFTKGNTIYFKKFLDNTLKSMKKYISLLDDSIKYNNYIKKAHSLFSDNNSTFDIINHQIIVMVMYSYLYLNNLTKEKMEEFSECSNINKYVVSQFDVKD